MSTPEPEQSSEQSEQSQDKVLQFDVVIAGGGLSGCLAALSLAQMSAKNSETPLSIAIIEANDVDFSITNQSHSLSFDERVLALSHGTADYLKALGAWQYLAEYANPIETIHISDRGQYGKARIYAEAHKVKALGYVAEMRSIGTALIQTIKKHHNISWFCAEKISDIQWQQSQVSVRLASNKILQSKLLLACDGANSVCRKFANIPTEQKSYQQSALITNVKMAKAHQNIAYERFTEFGPIAMLPLTADRCSLVWTLKPEQAEQLKNCDQNTFITELNQAFGFWQGGVNTVGERFVYPLTLVQAKENAFHRLALIGNAAHTIHPIAGQGFNLGVRDVMSLSSLVAQALANNQDIGRFSLLNQYAEHRKADHGHIIELTDSLVTLFSNKLPPLVAGRNIALKLLNYLQPLKQGFVKKTMGY